MEIIAEEQMNPNIPSLEMVIDGLEKMLSKMKNRVYLKRE